MQSGRPPTGTSSTMPGWQKSTPEQQSPNLPYTKAMPSPIPWPAANWRESLSAPSASLRRLSTRLTVVVFKGEKVPASEKIVSFFEDHTDIIVKGKRDTEYGHKIFLSGGASCMILGCLILRGNPADSDQYQALLEQHRHVYGRMPRQVTADGGFASKDNLAFAKRTT